MAVVLGVDIGTGSAKAVAYDEAGRALASASRPVSLHSPGPDRSEQDADEILAAAEGAVADAAAALAAAGRGVDALSFSAAMHSVLPVDRAGKAAGPNATWADNPAAPYARALASSPGAAALYARTAVPIHAMTPLCKLIRLRDLGDPRYAAAARFVSAKEYVAAAWTGEWAVDYGSAGGTGLFNVRTLDCDDEALSLAGIGRSRLSALAETTAVVGRVTAEAARRLDVPAGTPVVCGAPDGVLANLGTGATRPGTFAVTVGTSGAVRAPSDAPLADPKGRTFSYYLADGRWVSGGPVNNGGIAVRWALDSLVPGLAAEARAAGKDPFAYFDERAARVSAGSDGLLFLPFLAGERAPLWNSDARGCFFGVNLRHGSEHFMRAVLEGVIFSLRSVAVLVEQLSGPADAIRASGGFGKSALWRSILAGVFDRPVYTSSEGEASCLGAALLGFRALGVLPDLDAAAALCPPGDLTEPDPAAAEAYRELFLIYDRLVAACGAEFGAISDYQRRRADDGSSRTLNQ